MRFVADLHLHSRYARATSRDLSPESLHRWSALKGLSVVGTGDFTHPAWLAELQEKLEPAEPGLYRLKPAWRGPVEDSVPPSCRSEVRFLLSAEISCIYKKNGRTRKVHNLVLLPDFAAAAGLVFRLEAIGNLRADGRPILGLDSRALLEICLEVCPEALFIPAHIWTPHFSVLGSSSGFDTLEECFEDLLPHVYAVETGLSSDPPMNWRLSALDRMAIVSNSDAHSPQKLGREATCFDTELSYPAIRAALRDRDPDRFAGTLEFYPEEGKYHYDGHRRCQVRWKPPQTLAAGGICPVCGGRLTVGVLHRVELLADRPEGTRPPGSRPFSYLIPLVELVGAVLGVGPTSRQVGQVYDKLLAGLGPELYILRHVSPEEVVRHGEPLVAEGLRRMRAGQVEIAPGYDGEYGTIRLFDPSERRQWQGQSSLFAVSAGPSPALERPGPRSKKPEREPVPLPTPGPAPPAADPLDPAQRQALEAAGPVVVVAGPGSGKTRTLTQRIAYLIRARGVGPGQVLALTFTNRAAAEVRERLRLLLPEDTPVGEPAVGTFHRVALDLLRQYGAATRTILDEREARSLLVAALRGQGLALRPARAQEHISLAKAEGARPGDLEGSELGAAYRAYQERLTAFLACDYDDILLDFLDLLRSRPQVREELGARFPHVLVDEFQDLNSVQYQLVALLAGRGDGLFAIGDPDQAIYGFRGARPRYLSQLRQDYPGTRTFYLETSYRSADPIVRAAAALISHNAGREPMHLRSRRQDGPRLRVLEVPGETAEGIAVVRAISDMVGGADMVQSDQGAGNRGSRSLGDFGVLFRTSRQARILEECFLQEGLPYCLVGQQGFLQRPGVRQALAFCRFVLRPRDRLRLLGAMAVDAFHPGRQALAELERHLAAAPASDLWAGLAPDTFAKVQALVEAGEQYRRLSGQAGPTAFLRCWQEQYGAAGNADLEPLVRLAGRASSLEEFLDLVLLGQETDYERTGGTASPVEAIRLMTLHAAKGLEFPVVFICGVEDGLIPLREGDADLEEERRLFYVGLTRARDEVVLLWSRRRTHRGRRLQRDPSPFLRELPPELLVEEKVAPPGQGQPQQLTLF